MAAARSTQSASEWDFFISYTGADRAWAEWIAWQLEERGFRVLLQAWDFVAGVNWISAIHQGAQSANRTLVVLSEAYLSSGFAAAEWQAAWRQDPQGTAGKLFVVRISECDRPGLLGSVVGVDLMGLTQEQAETQLSSAIEAAITGRNKPQKSPKYPLTESAGTASFEKPRYPGLRPAIWNVPLRNPNFTGRAPELARLHEDLRTYQTVAVHALHGMSGVGKTQLAIEYAHGRASHYDLVWWINAEEVLMIKEQLLQLHTEIGLEGGLFTPLPVDDMMIVRAIHRRLEDCGAWLLVFDNTGNPEDLAPMIPPGPGHVLITTRGNGFRALGRVLDLAVLKRDESIDLLCRRAPSVAHDDATSIAERLGDLPLALDQAAAYLDQTGMSAREYVDLLDTRASDLYARGKSSGHPETIATMWSVSLDRLKTESPAAVQLLLFCAWLAPGPIPLDLFTENPDFLPFPQSDKNAYRIHLADTVAVLCDYSLMTRTGDDIVVHRLVQDVVRQQVRAGLWDSWTLRSILALLYNDLPGVIDDAPENWPRWRQLLTHVLAAAGHAEVALDVGSAAHAAWLLDRAGTYLYVQGRPTDAAPLMKRAIQLHDNLGNSENIDKVKLLNNYGLALTDMGQPEVAVGILEQALTILDASGQSDEETLADVLDHLGWSLMVLGDPAGARPVYDRALRIRESLHGKNDFRILADLNGLGRALADLNDPALALPLHERALAICENHYGPDHPWVGTTLNYLGRALRALNRSEEALAMHERALSIREAVYGPNHPWVAITLHYVGTSLTDLGDPDRSMPLHERAIKIHQEAYGPRHSAVDSGLEHIRRAREIRDQLKGQERQEIPANPTLPLQDADDD